MIDMPVLKSYYEKFQQTSRPQQAGLLSIVIGALLYFFVLLPWYHTNQAHLVEIDDKMSLLTWMRANAPRLIGQTTQAAKFQTAGPLLTVLEKAMADLPAKDKRLTEASTGIVELNFTEAGFDPLMSWLIQLDNQGIVVIKARLTPVKAGVINAVVSVRRGSQTSP